jgi:hypothetical protein
MITISAQAMASFSSAADRKLPHLGRLRVRPEKKPSTASIAFVLIGHRPAAAGLQPSPISTRPATKSSCSCAPTADGQWAADRCRYDYVSAPEVAPQCRRQKRRRRVSSPVSDMLSCTASSSKPWSTESNAVNLSRKRTRRSSGCFVGKKVRPVGGDPGAESRRWRAGTPSMFHIP